MPKELPPSETWLTLAQAAQHFDVHPTTLRRWADKGQIPHMLTPGGHRRFSLSDIEAFTDERKQEPSRKQVPQLWAEQAMTQTRQDISEHASHEPWLVLMDEAMRQQHRVLGRRLMGLTLQFISSNEENGSILEEARGIGREYGRIGVNISMPLTNSLQASMFFRDKLIEVALHLPESTHIRPDDNLRLMQRINTLMNAVHLAIAEVYADQ